RREQRPSPTVRLQPTSNEADGPTPPRPSGLGLFGLLASLLTPHRPLRVCSSLAPRQQAKEPPAKSEFIFERTLNATWRRRRRRLLWQDFAMRERNVAKGRPLRM